jgi:hypothetical protein
MYVNEPNQFYEISKRMADFGDLCLSFRSWGIDLDGAGHAYVPGIGKIPGLSK